MDRRVIQDYDASSVRSTPRTTIAVAKTGSEQISEELQLLFDGELAGRTLSGIVGGYYFKEDLDASNVIGAAPVNPLSDPPRIYFAGEGTTEAFAAFWHLKYEVLDQVALRLGGRYNDEERSIFNTALLRTNNGTGPQAPQDLSRINGSKSFQEYTNEAGLDYSPARDVMFYYTYSEGFKSGAGLLAQTDSGIIDPETVTNHEVGMKSQLLDNTLILNVSAFTADVEGLQRQRSLPNAGLTGLTTLFLNAAELSVDGVEVDATFAATDRLRVNATVAYLDAVFNDFLTVSPLDATQTPVNVKGSSPDRAPEWKGTLGFDYTLPVSNGAGLTFSANAAYTGEQYFSEFNIPIFGEDAYTLVDASITYESADDRWTAQLWGKNLTDEFRHTEINTNSVGRVLVGAFTPPRTWGVTVGYNF